MVTIKIHMTADELYDKCRDRICKKFNLVKVDTTMKWGTIVMTDDVNPYTVNVMAAPSMWLTDSTSITMTHTLA